MKRLLLIGAAFAPLLLVHPAAAQMESREAISLQNQILELRHELETVQAQQQGAAPQGYYAQPPGYAATAQGGSGDLVAQLLTRVNTLEETVRELRGRVDELQNSLQTSTADLDKQIGDLKFQMQNGSPAAGAPPPGHAPSAELGTMPPPPTRTASNTVAPPPPPAATGPRTPEVALQEGYAAFGRGDYTASEKDAQEVLSKRASPRAYDAQFLLAQSLAGQHQWSRAAIAYDDAYNRSPKGNHAESSLLGLANSLTAINEKRAACETITKLHTQFPKPRAELVPQISATSERAGCK